MMACGAVYTASETLALPGGTVLLGRRPCGRLLPTASRRSTPLHPCRLQVSARADEAEVGGEDGVSG